jgi:SAM-dependent methyltransferase
MSTERAAYLDYVADTRFTEGYREYQRRYAERPRESDRVLVEMVDAFAAPGAEVLDLGCSTGNLLRHLRNARPDLRLTGGDLIPGHLEECRADADLHGITFTEMDALAIGRTAAWDVITLNAVLYLFTPDQFRRALASTAAALRPGGALMVFDLFHPHGQELTITEASETHPEGLTLHFRSYATVEAAAAAAGFATPRITPFRIPIDLPKPEDDDLIVSYTVPAADGERLLFRGTLHQPWCHAVFPRA